MFDAPESPYLVPFDGSFAAANAPTGPPAKAPGKKARREGLAREVEQLAELQRILYAFDRHAVLLIFQAMDAAGKDGTIRAVTSGIDPSGCQVSSFKQPSKRELDHDFLWRTYRELPERGRIGIFNRSYYEDVLVVRVHPELLESQQLPSECVSDELWQQRFESIRDMEKHLARNGTLILKFWLYASKEEQKKRFLARIDDPDRNWKFSPGDVVERGYWDDYTQAFEEAVNATSRPWAPWYAIPADSKSYMRWTVAQIFRAALQSLDLRYPTLSPEEQAEMLACRKKLVSE